MNDIERCMLINQIAIMNYLFNLKGYPTYGNINLDERINATEALLEAIE